MTVIEHIEKEIKRLEYEIGTPANASKKVFSLKNFHKNCPLSWNHVTIWAQRKNNVITVVSKLKENNCS